MSSSAARRVASHTLRRLRIRARRVAPAGVTDTHATRRSAPSVRRATRPAASSLVTTFVTLGGATRSTSASAPRVSGPCRSIGRERGELARREVGPRLLAEPAGEPGGAEPQPVGHGERVRVVGGIGARYGGPRRWSREIVYQAN